MVKGSNEEKYKIVFTVDGSKNQLLPKYTIEKEKPDPGDKPKTRKLSKLGMKPEKFRSLTDTMFPMFPGLADSVSNIVNPNNGNTLEAQVGRLVKNVFEDQKIEGDEEGKIVEKAKGYAYKAIDNVLGVINNTNSKEYKKNLIEKINTKYPNENNPFNKFLNDIQAQPHGVLPAVNLLRGQTVHDDVVTNIAGKMAHSIGGIGFGKYTNNGTFVKKSDQIYLSLLQKHINSKNAHKDIRERFYIEMGGVCDELVKNNIDNQKYVYNKAVERVSGSDETKRDVAGSMELTQRLLVIMRMLPKEKRSDIANQLVKGLEELNKEIKAEIEKFNNLDDSQKEIIKKYAELMTIKNQLPKGFGDEEKAERSLQEQLKQFTEQEKVTEIERVKIELENLKKYKDNEAFIKENESLFVNTNETTQLSRLQSSEAIEKQIKSLRRLQENDRVIESVVSRIVNKKSLDKETIKKSLEKEIENKLRDGLLLYNLRKTGLHDVPNLSEELSFADFKSINHNRTNFAKLLIDLSDNANNQNKVKEVLKKIEKIKQKEKVAQTNRATEQSPKRSSKSRTTTKTTKAKVPARESAEVKGDGVILTDRNSSFLRTIWSLKESNLDAVFKKGVSEGLESSKNVDLYNKIKVQNSGLAPNIRMDKDSVEKAITAIDKHIIENKFIPEPGLIQALKGSIILQETEGSDQTKVLKYRVNIEKFNKSLDELATKNQSEQKGSATKEKWTDKIKRLRVFNRGQNGPAK